MTMVVVGGERVTVEVLVCEGVMLGTTLPTDGTGELMRGDMDGMLASWERRVTPAAACSPPAHHHTHKEQ